MSLQSILKNKNKEIDRLVGQFNKVYSRIMPEIYNEVQELFKAGVFNYEIIQSIFVQYGFQDLYQSFVDDFSEMIKYSKEISNEIGIGFKLTDDNYELLDALATQVETNFSVSLAKYSNDLARAGLQSKLGGMGFRQIVEELKGTLDGSVRRWETEAYTGITQFDSAMNYQTFQNAGITRFFYSGPADERTRDVCLHTLGDDRQSTGWTLAEINSSNTPFMERGGYNCRHEWLPFTGG